MKRIAVIRIIIEQNRKMAEEVQKLLSENADIIQGRMGIPNMQDDIFIISVVIKAENERISALTGKLGRLKNISVKAAITSVEVE
jgi:putative iron-only hydrogenase system regulator